MKPTSSAHSDANSLAPSPNLFPGLGANPPGLAAGGVPDTPGVPNTPGVADSAAAGSGEPPRLRRPDRAQVILEPLCLDERLPDDHRARAVWALVERLDLTKFHEPIAARGATPGRAATDPKLLVALWLFATVENVGSARQLERLCGEHDAYRWLCGGVTINHHTLSDFRVGHEQALDDLMTQAIVMLNESGVLDGGRLSQDSLRTRASAGAGSFRREKTLRELLEKAKAQVQALKQQADESPADLARKAAVESARQTAARRRAARERVERVEAALALMPDLQAIKDNHNGKPTKDREPRASTTDPDARRMKLANGAMGPGYNVQFGTDTASRAIVAVDVINRGNDQGQCEPLRAQAEKRMGRKVREHLVDGGYLRKESFERAEQSGVAMFAPLPKGRDGQPCTQARDDGPGAKAWRARMTTEEGKDIYKERASTSETVNAETKTYRGLGRFMVRGLEKVRSMALWSALAYNFVHFAPILTG